MRGTCRKRRSLRFKICSVKYRGRTTALFLKYAKKRNKKTKHRRTLKPVQAQVSLEAIIQQDGGDVKSLLIHIIS